MLIRTLLSLCVLIVWVGYSFELAVILGLIWLLMVDKKWLMLSVSAATTHGGTKGNYGSRVVHGACIRRMFQNRKNDWVLCVHGGGEIASHEYLADYPIIVSSISSQSF